MVKNGIEFMLNIEEIEFIISYYFESFLLLFRYYLIFL